MLQRGMTELEPWAVVALVATCIELDAVEMQALTYAALLNHFPVRAQRSTWTQRISAAPLTVLTETGGAAGYAPGPHLRYKHRKHGHQN